MNSRAVLNATVILLRDFPGVVVDISLLANADAFVGTFSSAINRVAWMISRARKVGVLLIRSARHDLGDGIGGGGAQSASQESLRIDQVIRCVLINFHTPSICFQY